MKKIISGVLIAGTLLVSQASCVGTFGLFNKLAEWNNNLSNKFINELVYIALHIIPVYSIALFIDYLIINTIEFWTGSNPLAMNEGDVEQQMVKGKDGNDYLITATKNKFEIKGIQTNDVAELVYNPVAMSWTAIADGEATTLMEGLTNSDGKLTGEVSLNVNGSAINYDLNSGNVAQLEAEVSDAVNSLAVK